MILLEVQNLLIIKQALREDEKVTIQKKEVEISVRLKYLRNFWRTLDIPLINYKINIILTWPENCV